MAKSQPRCSTSRQRSRSCVSEESPGNPSRTLGRGVSTSTGAAQGRHYRLWALLPKGCHRRMARKGEGTIVHP
jgi:hypothetical protein